EHRDHPGHLQGAGDVDASEARVRVRRTDQARVGLAGDVDVVAVAPRARDEARVFAAADGLAEALTGRAGAGVEERRHQIRLWTNSAIASSVCQNRSWQGSTRSTTSGYGGPLALSLLA